MWIFFRFQLGLLRRFLYLRCLLSDQLNRHLHVLHLSLCRQHHHLWLLRQSLLFRLMSKHLHFLSCNQKQQQFRFRKIHRERLGIAEVHFHFYLKQFQLDSFQLHRVEREMVIVRNDLIAEFCHCHNCKHCCMLICFVYMFLYAQKTKGEGLICLAILQYATPIDQCCI